MHPSYAFQAITLFAFVVVCLWVIWRGYKTEQYRWWEDQRYKNAIKMRMGQPAASDAEIADWCWKHTREMDQFERFRGRDYYILWRI
jgi:hypothetical protein